VSRESKAERFPLPLCSALLKSKLTIDGGIESAPSVVSLSLARRGLPTTGTAEVKGKTLAPRRGKTVKIVTEIISAMISQVG
jgi:hypothetical protein